MSKLCKQYVASVHADFGRQLLSQPHTIVCGKTPLLLVIGLAMTDMMTKTATAQSRFRKYDGSNHIKVVEDVIKDLLGVDDSQNLSTQVYKFSAASEATVIYVAKLPSDNPLCPESLEVITDVLRRLAVHATQ